MDNVYRIILLSCLVLVGLTASLHAHEKEHLRILSWEGYVIQEELDEINRLLDRQGYPYEAAVIEPDAEGAEQMFDLIRGKKADITFLTLFFIKIEKEQTSKLLQPINTESPRLTNYQYLLPDLTRIAMGLNKQREPLYIPWGGGAYGFYVDRNRVDAASIPRSVGDLWLPQWKNKYSLNQSQAWYNVGLALMSMGMPPFYLHELAIAGRRDEIIRISNPGGELQTKLTQLYANAGNFWKASPAFNDELLIVSSWGPEVAAENKNGGNWQMIDFAEGNMVWLDTINFVKDLKDRKLEAAEIVANYYIGKKVQTRISRQLSMVAASSIAEPNQQFGSPAKIFQENNLVPPYDNIAYDIMKRMTERATMDSIAR